MKKKKYPKIIDRRQTKLSKWVTVIERDILFPDCDKHETYHSVKPFDYVSILALTSDQRIPLVKQYRPILEKESLELPGGLVDSSKSPEETALLELREETGLVVSSVQPIGVLNPDPGRLENRFFCYFSPNAKIDTSATIESGIELVWTDLPRLREMILDGRFNSSPQISLIALASFRGLIDGLMP
jgi:ADP-ribose pyrophosphatase